MQKLIFILSISVIIQSFDHVILAQEILNPDDQESSFFQAVRANQKESYLTINYL